MDKFQFQDITEALLRLQAAFERADLAAPGIVLGSQDDMRRLAGSIRQQDLVFEVPRVSAAELAVTADFPKTSPIERRPRATIVGTKVYEPHEIARR